MGVSLVGDLGQQIERAEIPACVDKLLGVDARKFEEPVEGGGIGPQQFARGLERTDDGRVQQRGEDVVLVLEIVVERGLPNADRIGDHARRGTAVAVTDEQLACGVEDLVACSGSAPLGLGQARPPGAGAAGRRGTGHGGWLLALGSSERKHAGRFRDRISLTQRCVTRLSQGFPGPQHIYHSTEIDRRLSIN